MQDHPNSTKVGAAFESQVAALFAAAGYKVERNPSWPGQQIDIVATSFDNFGLPRRVIVECKYISSGSISNTTVQEFVTFVKPLLDKGFSAGVMISNRDFSLPAKHFARGYPFLELRTYQELEDALFDFSASFVSSINEYQHTQIANSFIDLHCTKDSGLTPTVGLSYNQNLPKVSVIPELLRAMASDSPAYFAFILGDFGAGKTTIIERLNFFLQEKYVKDRTQRFPLILRLNRYAEANNLSQFVESQIEFSLKKRISSTRIYELCSQGRAILFLDGFDEIATNASEYKRASYFESILPLIDLSRYTIITSRPSYFNSAAEFHKLIKAVASRRFEFGGDPLGLPRGRDIVGRKAFETTWAELQSSILGPKDLKILYRSCLTFTVDKLDSAQILGYISKYSQELAKIQNITPSELYEILINVYDISDLMTRPLLLRLVIDVVLIGQINIRDPNLSIGPAGLYKMYIDAHLAIDWAKGASRHFLEKNERLLFARGMALAMLYGDGNLSVSYEDIIDKVINTIGELPEDRQHVLINQTEEVSTDVRVCSFLRLMEGNRFQFIHKSFMEYFIADLIREDLHRYGESDVLRANLNYEILYFLGSFALIEADLVDILSDSSTADRPEAYRRNVVGALLYSGKDVTGIKVGKATVDRLRFKTLSINDSTFRGTILKDIALSELICKTSKLRPLIVNNLLAERLDFDRCAGRLTAQEANIANLRIHRCPELEVQFEKCSLNVCDVSRAKALSCSDDTRIMELQCSDTEVIFAGNRGQDGGIAKAAFRDSRMKSEKGKDGSFYRRFGEVQFDRCRFEGFHIFVPKTGDLTFSSCDGYIFIEYKNDDVALFNRSYKFDTTKMIRAWAFQFGILFMKASLFQSRPLKEVYQFHQRLTIGGESSTLVAELDVAFGSKDDEDVEGERTSKRRRGR